MPAALLDTNGSFAGTSARDDYHDRAREIPRGIDHGDLPAVVVRNDVVTETLNLTGEKLGPDAARGANLRGADAGRGGGDAGDARGGRRHRGVRRGGGRPDRGGLTTGAEVEELLS
jgi:hypothetical protein